MNVRCRSAFAAALFGASLAACSSPAADVAFKPPPGWKSSVAMFGMMQVWTHDDRPGSMIMLMRVPILAGASEVDRSLKTQFSDQKPIENKVVKICGNQPAHLTVFSATSKKSSKRDRVEMISTVVGDALYMSMYGRSEGDAADPAAESAIKMLCPKKA